MRSDAWRAWLRSHCRHGPCSRRFRGRPSRLASARAVRPGPGGRRAAQADPHEPHRIWRHLWGAPGPCRAGGPSGLGTASSASPASGVGPPSPRSAVGGRASQPLGGTRGRGPPPTSWIATSRPRDRTSSGSPTSPSSRPRQAFSTSRSCWMPGADASWAGPWPTICARSSCSMLWRWRWVSADLATSSPTAIRGRNIRPWPSAVAAARWAFDHPRARSATPTTMPVSRELLRDARMRTARPAALRLASPGPHGRVHPHRGLLQSGAPPLGARLPLPHPL